MRGTMLAYARRALFPPDPAPDPAPLPPPDPKPCSRVVSIGGAFDPPPDDGRPDPGGLT